MTAPYLDHVYNGPAVRIPEPDELELRYETLTGAFAVLYRDDQCAIIDNGEQGEAHGRWLVTLLDRLVKP